MPLEPRSESKRQPGLKSDTVVTVRVNPADPPKITGGIGE
jgi:hypothetical protein